jgi:ATP-dependent helicase/DNAse subunit B
MAALDQACSLFTGHTSFEPVGVSALQWLEKSLHTLTVQTSRFGDPAIYLGTLAGVRGLRFRAIRILGLAEGSVPSASKEDPVLPDAARAALSPFLLDSRQRAHRQVAAFDDAIRSARERLCLSAPLASIEGSIRQPASVLLDVMRALTGSNVELEKQLERAAARGRAQEREARDRSPLSGSAQLARIARGDMQAAGAEQDPALLLDALRAIRDRTEPSAQDGLLAGLQLPNIAGLSPERPISASRLNTLLSCPHRFLYENILGFREPEQPLQTHSLNAMLFGTWLHLIAEEFWTEHGAAMAARSGDLALVRGQLRELASKRFEALQQSYPFISAHVAHAEGQTLCDQLDKLLELDWNEGESRTFVAVERAFGYAGDCELTTEAGPLFVRGKIDKLDCIDGTLVVRDIKTSIGKPRRANAPPDPSIDLQLAVYALVAKRMAREWNTPEDVAVAYIYLRSGDHERAWRGADYTILEHTTRTWLAAAREILAVGAFARTPNLDDCRYCAFKPVCAPERQRAAAVLADPRVPKRLKLLKLPEDA